MCSAVRSAGGDRRSLAAGTAPRPLSPWQETQRSANRARPAAMERAEYPVGDTKKLVGKASAVMGLKRGAAQTSSTAAAANIGQRHRVPENGARIPTTA